MSNPWYKNIGPGPLIAAAFIGPGTVTVCTLAGVKFGYALLWAMALSVVATIVLQEMAARLGLITGRGLSAVIRSEINNPVIRGFMMVLMVSAIIIGNAAYEAGNISGGVLGLEAVVSKNNFKINNLEINFIPIIIGIIALIVLGIGKYKIIERFLVSLVILMSLSFITAALFTKPNFWELIKGVFVPDVPENSLLTVVGLIGTTVVPYNLFLHASLVSEKWKGISDLPAARRDSFLAIILGGMVSMGIIVTASAIQGAQVENAADLARSLEPLYGNSAKIFLGIGLFAAGLTSAITAPLAAAYVAAGCFGWSAGISSVKFRSVWVLVIVIGVFVSSLGLKPISIIQFAQIANGLLLPIIAGFLLWVTNRKRLLGKYTNAIWLNVIAVAIILIVVGLGVKSILMVLKLI